MRTHGHREGGTTHCGLLGGIGEGQWVRGAGEGQPGEKCQMWVKGWKAAKHTAMCVPMQLSCMFCTCTPKPKTQLKKKKQKESCGNKELIHKIPQIKILITTPLINQLVNSLVNQLINQLICLYILHILHIYIYNMCPYIHM